MRYLYMYDNSTGEPVRALHCPNLSYATQLSSNVSAKLILRVWSWR